MKFMLLYMAPVSAEQQMNVSPEEMKKGMEPGLHGTKKAEKQSSTWASLGKGTGFEKKGSSKTQTQVAGYSIVRAKDVEAVKPMTKDHPHLLMPKTSIEVFEIMSIQM